MSPRLGRWLSQQVKASLCPSRSRRLLVEELETRLTPSGVNVPLTTDPGVQQMPSVAVDPRDPGHIAVAYMDYSLRTTGYAGIGAAVSHDAGGTWQRTAVPLPATCDDGAGNPVAQFDDQGRLFVTYMAATFLGPNRPGIINPSIRNPVLGVRERTFGFQANNGIFVVRSDDGGLTWNQPVAVVEHLYDGQNKVPYEIMPDLAVDTFRNLPDGRPNPNYGSLYDVWARYYPSGQFPGQPTATGGSQLFFSVSHDGGQTWQLQLKPPAGTDPPATVIDTFPDTGVGLAEGTGYAFWSHLTIGPEGDLYVANSAAGYFAVHHSTDAGATFTNPDPATSAFFPFGSNEFVFPTPTLANNHFPTIGVRAVAADPLRPGTIYVADGFQVTDSDARSLDESDVIFARSTDYGVTWQTTFQVGPHTRANVLNDDNDGYRPTGRPEDVAGGQTLPRLVTDAQGDVAVIWYDTRRDPADHLLDVFGTVSTDGGQTFSPNFRVSDQSFDADAGRFINAEGSTDFYLGDSIGLALANHTAYAAWTDTRNGNQDVFFSSYPINPPPAAANDRFEPNDTAATATNLGRVVVRDLPKLAIAPGDEDWFRVQAAATGNLTVTATLAAPGDSVRLELRDASGATLLATGIAVRDASGQMIGQSLTFPGPAGQTYRVRVLPGSGAIAGTPARYALDVRSLTADLGTQVFGAQSGSLAAGDEAIYALSAAAPGSLEVTLTPGASASGNFHLELLDTNTQEVLASGQTAGTTQYASLAVTSGQAVFLHVFGDAGAQGDFTLTFTNLDQYATPDNKTLFFPTGAGPSEAVLADLTGNGRLDIVVSHIGTDVVSVLLNNGDGTFQAPRDYAVGAFVQGSPSALTGLPNFHRDLAVADFNRDGIPDLVVVNHDSGDVSVLLGRGDGTFAPQHRFDATAAPFALAVGDLNHDGIPDLAVVDSTAAPAQGVVLLGRGDGTFRAPIPFSLPPSDPFRTSTLLIADLNHDGNNDLLYRDFLEGTFVLPGNGDGTFGSPTPIQTRNGPGLAVADLNADGQLDVVNTNYSIDSVAYSLGNGDGTFQPEQDFPAASVGRSPVAVAVADFGSGRDDGSLGPPDGHPDLILADNGLDAAAYTGPPEIVLLPGLVDSQGQFAGFGNPIHLASVRGPLDVKVADVNGDGAIDIVAVDADSVEVIYGKPPVIPPNSTPQTARNLGTVVHVVEPTQTIVPGHVDAYYTLTVPIEAAHGAGDEILDFSGLFQALRGPGLGMEVRDAAGHLLGAGERFRVRAPQGAVLTLHVFGVAGGVRGSGAYTLDIDVLPQVVSVEDQPLLPGTGANPGGPTTSLVVTLQGDRLDPASAENPANYRVTWLGPDGLLGTADDLVIPIRAVTAGGQPIVYDSSANIEVATGTVYPTAVRQTVTLLFADPLPAGSYQFELTSAIQAAPFNEDEAGLLSGGVAFTGHPVASLVNGTVTEGSRGTVANLVLASGMLGDLGVWQTGTPFLTQLHDDLAALLDAALTAHGDALSISDALNNQILDRFNPALGALGDRPLGVLVIWLDPVSADLEGSSNNRVVFNPQNNSFQNTFSRGFVSVAGTVEVVVIPFVQILSTTSEQNYRLSVDLVSSVARGGVVYLGPEGNLVIGLTTALRLGTTQFVLPFGDPALSALAAPQLVGASQPGGVTATPGTSQPTGVTATPGTSPPPGGTATPTTPQTPATPDLAGPAPLSGTATAATRRLPAQAPTSTPTPATPQTPATSQLPAPTSAAPPLPGSQDDPPAEVGRSTVSALLFLETRRETAAVTAIAPRLPLTSQPPELPAQERRPPASPPALPPSDPPPEDEPDDKDAELEGVWLPEDAALLVHDASPAADVSSESLSQKAVGFGVGVPASAGFPAENRLKPGLRPERPRPFGTDSKDTAAGQRLGDFDPLPGWWVRDLERRLTGFGSPPRQESPSARGKPNRGKLTMPDHLATVDTTLPPELGLRINEVCDRFEAAWKAAAHGAPGPRLEEYLADVPAVDPALLLPHLLLLEIDYRRLRGEQPTTSDYENRFPKLSGRFLAAVLPAQPAEMPRSPAAPPANPGREAGGEPGMPAAPPPAENENAEPISQAEATVLLPPFNPQLRSGRYVLRQFHAKGGLGEVWLADDAEIGRCVALKRLRKKREEHEERFLVEAQITGQLEHPGIVPVHDLGVDEEGRPFYVMSFIHGRTLKEVIADYHTGHSTSGEPLEVQGTRLLEIFVKVCEAVAYAHHRGVVHRDVKPDNVMLGPFGETVVLDWGMAKVRSQPEGTGAAAPVQLTYSSGSRETQAGMVMGSPVYMAPEMAEGRPSDANEQTDVYLLGATLYHILTGQPPREGSSYEEILELARTVPAPSPRRRKADVPRALEAICLKAMAHRQRDRYGGALELAQDVQRYLAGAPVAAYREPIHARAWRWCKRHRRGLARSLTAALVLTLAVLGVTQLRDAWNMEEATRREADELRLCAQARRDLAEFHRLAEERQFYAVSTTPAAETALYYDARRGQAAGEKALALAERLAGEMAQLPLRAERATLDRDLHNLLLLTAQTQSQQTHDPRAVTEIMDRLKRAAALLGPSRSYHRLRARCYQTLGDRQQAAEEEQRAAAAQPTALDHFLEAEEYRIRSGSPAEASGDVLAWQPNARLLRQAIVHYRRALQLEPENFWCHLQMGRCYLSLGQGSEAVEALGTCVALRPKAPWGYSARGLTLGLTRRFADGEADLRQALAIDPQFAPALLHRGLLAWLQRKDDRALADFTGVLQSPADRRLIEAAYYRGQLRLERQEFADALQDFDLVVKETPSFRPVYLSRAQVHFLRGDDARGLADLTTFLDRGSAKPFDPRDARLFALRGRLLHQLVPHWGLPPREFKAKLRLAWNELTTARQLGHRSAELFDDLGSVAQRLGEWQGACAVYEEALQSAPRDLAVKVRTKRGWIYAQSPREHDKARADFAEAVRLDATHADAHAGLGYLHALQKEPSGAQRAAAQALWHARDDYLVLHNVACIYAELSRTEKVQATQHRDMAVALLERAVELCRRGGGGAREIENIRGDSSFDVLRGRPDFEKLLKGKGYKAEGK